jgi:hypothetical protein
MTAIPFTSARARLELTVLNAEAESVASSDLYAWLRESGLPSEAAIRLTHFVDTVQHIGGQLISIGKIVLLKIIEFCRAHPNLSAGVAVGAAVSAIVLLIPILGSYLAPIAFVLGVTIGAVAGHRLDQAARGESHKGKSEFMIVTESLIEIAREFFALLSEIINTVANSRSPG